VKLKTLLLMVIAACALCTLTAPALANYRVEKGAKGEGRGVFTFGGKDEFKCSKAVYTPASEPGRDAELKLRVKYEECPIELSTGGQLVATVSEAQLRLNRGKETRTEEWAVRVELQSKFTIKINTPLLEDCVIMYEAAQPRQISWKNRSPKESKIGLTLRELNNETKGCLFFSIENGKHKNDDLKEEVQMKGVKHN